MGLKGTIKECLGLIRAKIFGVTAGQRVYIGKHRSLKGKHHITFEDSVTVRPYTQIWSGGTVRIGRGSELVNDAGFSSPIHWKSERKFFSHRMSILLTVIMNIAM